MNEVAITEGRALTVNEIKAQIQIIQQVMAAVMKKDVHYGTIPGTPKPTLYKPGSELILTTFHIGVDPSENVTDLSTYDEIRYRVAAKGFSQATGTTLGYGVGECSSNEEKYKWRKPVCDQEFDETPDDRKRTVWKKGSNGGAPYQLKQVRMNPPDVANTILKMAKKRAQIDMTLTVTAASDVFEQDLEDLPEGMVDRNGAETKPPIKEPQKKTAPAEDTHTAQITVKDVTSKSDEKNGKAYTIFTIFDEAGTKYGTFSDTFADLATSAKESELPVSVTYTTGKFGNKIVNLEVVAKD